MLDCEKDFITLHIDNILKTPFVRIRVSRKPVAFEQPPIRAGEVGNINLDVMSVVRLDAFGSLTEEHVLISSYGNRCRYRSIAHSGICGGAHNLSIETRDLSGGSRADIELDICEGEFSAPELQGRPVTAKAISPRAFHRHKAFAIDKTELRV